MLLMQSVVISSTFWPAIKNLISFFFYSSAGLAVYCHSATIGPKPNYSHILIHDVLFQKTGTNRSSNTLCTVLFTSFFLKQTLPKQ